MEFKVHCDGKVTKIKFDYEAYGTRVLALQSFIASHLNISFEDHNLFLVTRRKNLILLESTRRVDSIAEGSTLVVLEKFRGDKALVKIKFTSGAIVTKWFDADCEISEVKNWVELEYHIPPKRQILEFFGLEMKPCSRKLNDYIIDEDPVFELREIETDPATLRRVRLKVFDLGSGEIRKETVRLEARDTMQILLWHLRRQNVRNIGRRYQVMKRGEDAFPLSGVDVHELGIKDGDEVSVFIYK